MVVSWVMAENQAFDYRGYRYEPEVDVEPEEVSKLFHNVYGPDGQLVAHVKHSPYSFPSRGTVEAVIDGLIGEGGSDE